MEAKKIIITGGATRIVSAIAKSLVSFETKIGIHFNKSKSSALKLKKELEVLGAEVYLFKADLNNFKQTENLIKKKEGCVINIIDQRVEKLTPFFFSYTLSKSSLAVFTKTSAMKLGPNIRVNGISHGPTLKNKRQSEAHFKKQWKSTLLRKKVDLENICNGVKFLI